ncbi:hypothetical protein EI94DRAFT_1796978 [Lactarius quietus]|nr:hypothetical protein EI94DRAFT_1796978 [Lactarius quietus]
MGHDKGKVTEPQTNLPEKCTLSTNEEGPGSRLEPEVLSTPAKRGCIASPVHGHPMQLKVVRDDDASLPSSDRAGATPVINLKKGKQRGLQQNASFYPRYGEAASLLDPEAAQFLKSTYEELPVENEDDWIDDQDTTTLAQGLPSKMAEARAFERPLWEPDTPGQDPHSQHIESRALPGSSQHSSGNAAALQPLSMSIVTSGPSTSDTTVAVITEPSPWPLSMDLTVDQGG